MEHVACIVVAVRNVDAPEVNLGLARSWKSDGLLPGAIDLRLVGGG